MFQFRMLLSQVKSAIIGIAVIIAFWEGAAYYLKGMTPYAHIILPTIEQCLTEAIPGMAPFFWGGQGGLFQGQAGANLYLIGLLALAQNSAITVLRIISGLLWGAIVGIGTGIMMGMNDKVRKFLEPPIELIRTIPLLTLIPLFMYWFGISEIGRFLYIVYGVAVVLVINTINAIDNVPPVYKQFSLTMGASRGQVFRTVVLPAIVPGLAGGLKFTLALSWALTLAAEYLNALSGLGRIVILSEIHLFTDRMIVVVVLLIIYSLVLYAAFMRFYRFVTRWMPS